MHALANPARFLRIARPATLLLFLVGAALAVGGMVATMLLYNSVAVAVLTNAGTGARLGGVLTWPAVALHTALAVWCVACLRRGWRV